MNRLSFVKKNFPKQFETALTVDDISGNNKYLLWIAKQLANGHNITDISQTLKFFHNNTNKFKIKDINKYQDLKDLENIVKEFGMSNRQSKENDKEGSEKIYEDDNMIVVRTDSKKAMLIYGANTRWCTIMKKQTYFEDYVARGNEFYIVIRKVDTALTSPKYAIVRKSFLNFVIYDDQDNCDRLFSPEEQDKLQGAIKAIISDKPEKNIIKRILNNEVNQSEAVEWLKTQLPSTQEYVTSRRQELKFLCLPIDELISILSRKYERPSLDKVDEEKIIEIANRLKENSSKRAVDVKLYILDFLKGKNKLILSNDKNASVRAKLVSSLSPEEAEDFINDKSILVFRQAARCVSAQFLIEYINKSNSSNRKKIGNSVVSERMCKDKVNAFLLKQPIEVLKTLIV